MSKPPTTGRSDEPDPNNDDPNEPQLSSFKELISGLQPLSAASAARVSQSSGIQTLHFAAHGYPSKFYDSDQLQQLAVANVARADPKNIQEVAASQLSIINSYYQSGLQQSQQSFRWSLIWGGVGFGFLIIAITVLLLRQPTNVAYASGLAGALVEAFAGIYLYLYKHASDQLAAFRKSLESTQQLLLANSMCENLEGDIEQETRAELIRMMVSAAVQVPLPPSP